MEIELNAQTWILGALGALLVGLGKGGLPGVGNLTIAIYALILPARASVGILLPILLTADIVAVLVYRRHALWSYILRLLPWTLAGIVAGYFVFGRIDDSTVRLLIGWTLLVMTAVHFARQAILRKLRAATPERADDAPLPPPKLWFVGATGIAGGFATMIANAAGPIAALFLAASGLPKYAFIGTAAWFFLIVNVSKIPFMMDRGILHMDSLAVSARFMVFAIIGVLIGRYVIRFINQKLFEFLIWFFIVVAGLRLAIS